MKLSVRDHGVKGNKFGKWLKKQNISTNEPFVFEFGADIDQIQNIRLFFLASLHSSDKKSSTVAMAKKIIKTYNVTTIILEGFENEMSDDLNHDRSVIAQMFPGEIKYIAEYGLKKGIKLVGAEPSTAFLFSKLKQHFTTNEILLWEFLRHLKICRREQFSENKFLDDWTKNVLPFVNKALKRSADIPFNYAKTYMTIYGKPFNYEKTDVESTAPDITSSKVMRRVGAWNDLIRDGFAVNRVISKQKGVVLVLFGKNHIYAQFPALKKLYKTHKLLHHQ